MRKWNVKFDWVYGTFTPVLVKIVSMTSGDVLELGSGIYSTPLLHWLCSPCRRRLYTYDNDEKYIDMYQLRDFEDKYHKIICVKDWDDAEIEKGWDVVFVDHKPAERRRVDIARVAVGAEYVVVHDSHERKNYEYEDAFSAFSWRRDFRAAKRGTTVLSNFHNLENLDIC